MITRIAQNVCVVFLWLCAANAADAQIATTPETPCSATNRTDSDSDGLADDCELALAQRFAPFLIVRSGGCNWDESVSPPRLGGGYFFAVQPVGQWIRIAYIPAYFQDCGWSGVKCWLPWVDCTPHAGDSELVIVNVQRDEASRDWKVDGIFLSAHCFGRTGSDCRWYRGKDLGAFALEDGAPLVWVAEGRQANYASRDACDNGHHGVDTCDRHDLRYRFPIISVTQNVGSMAQPIGLTGCVKGLQLGSAKVQPDAEECFWNSQTPFRGWQATGRGVTSYWRYLTEIAEFGRTR